MIKDIAWNVFKSTGNVDTFLEFKQIKNIEKNIRNVSLITTTLMSIFALFAISSIGYQAANLTKINVGNEVLDLGEFAKASLGWACIVNFIMSLVTIILTVFTSKKLSKKKR